MSQVRYLFIGTCGWLFMLYNIERLATPANISSFVYIVTIVAAAVLLLAPRLSWLPYHWLLAVVALPMLMLKGVLGYPILGASWPITVIELGAVALTIGLAQTISQRLDKLHALLVNLTIGPVDKEVRPFSTGQSQLYREVRRARKFSRPASLLTISATAVEGDAKQSPLLTDAHLRRFLEEIQRETLKKHIATRLANLLVTELGDSAVITQRNGYFVTLLPETDREQLTGIVEQLKKISYEHLGLKLQIGVSTFPDEAVTFESMLEDAESAMRGVDSDNGEVKVTPFAGIHRQGAKREAEHRSSVRPDAEAATRPAASPAAPASLPVETVSEYRNGDQRDRFNSPLNPAG